MPTLEYIGNAPDAATPDNSFAPAAPTAPPTNSKLEFVGMADGSTPAANPAPATPTNPYDLTDPAQINSVMNAPGSNFVPTPNQWRAIYDAEKNQSWKDWATDVGKGAWEGAEAVTGDIAQAAKDSAGELTTPGEWKNIPGSLLQGAAKQTAADYDLVRKGVAKGIDAARYPFSTDEERYANWLQRNTDNLWSRRALERGVDDKGSMTPEALRPEKTLPGASAVGGFVGDPVFLAAGPAGEALAGPASRIAAGIAERVPGAAAALDAVKAVKNIPGKLADAVPGVLERVGGGIKRVAGMPEDLIAAGAEKLPGAVGDKVIHAVGTLGGLAGLTGEGGLIGNVLFKLKAAQALGYSAEQLGALGRHLVETDANSGVPRLLQLAKNADAPQWMRTLAGTFHDFGIGTAAQTAADLAQSAAHGAAIGGVIGAGTAENPAELGQLVGGGAPMGALGRVASKVTGLDARNQAARANAGALARLYDHLTAQGVAPETIAKLTDPTALMMGQAKDIFGKNLNFKVLTDSEFAAQGVTPGAGAFFDPASKTVVLNVDKQGRLPHELGHAILNAVGADGEARLRIDSVFSPQDIEKIGRQYAERFVDVGGKTFATPAEREQAIGDRLAQLNADYGGNKWIYDEIYADAGFGGLRGKDLFRDVVTKSKLSEIGDAARGKLFSMLGVNVDPNSGGRLPGALFDDPRVYGPELRQMVHEHLKKIYNEGPTAAKDVKQTKEGIPSGTPVPNSLQGSHPAAPMGPNPQTGRLENDFAVKDPVKGNVTMRTPAETRRIEKARQESVLQTIATKPELPKTAPVEETAPRIGPTGEKEITGTKIADQLPPTYGQWMRDAAKMIEGVIGKGDVIKTWYQAIGHGPNWRKMVAKRAGNIAASEVKIAPFLFKVSKEGNALVVGLSLTAAERKLAKWTASNKLDLWGGDPGQFKADLMTYLKNHAEGRPGADGIGDNKRNALNLFVIGKNKKFADLNPLRTSAAGDEREGIVRSLRLDRIAGAEKSPETGWNAEYPKKVMNLSPEAPKGPQRNFQYSPDVEDKNQRQPNDEVRRVADDYMKAAGIPHEPFRGYAAVDVDRAKKLADAYQAAAHDPEHPEVKAAYDALKAETAAQWQAMEAAGVKAEPWTKEGQPYASSKEMRADVADNKHLWYFPTERGFGEDILHNKNPLLEKDPDTGLVYNDMFRAVHDYFGHAKEGYEFGPRGEYNAYLAHSRMFTPEARPAMASETLGQNSWVNYGKHLRDEAGNIPQKGEPGFVPVLERPYAEQKTTVLPKELVDAATPKQFSPDVADEERPTHDFSKAHLVTKNPDGTPKTFYHGTSHAEALVKSGAFDNSRADKNALYGPGHYFTDDAKTAGGDGGLDETGYVLKDLDTAKRRDEVSEFLKSQEKSKWQKEVPPAIVTLARESRVDLAEALAWENPLLAYKIAGNLGFDVGIAPGVIPAHLDVRNPFEIEKNFTPKEINKLQWMAPRGTPLNDALTQWFGSDNHTGAELYRIVKNTRGAFREDVNKLLQKAGFDGITHIGGANTGNAPHRVVVAFGPEQIFGKFGGAARKAADVKLFSPDVETVADGDEARKAGARRDPYTHVPTFMTGKPDVDGLREKVRTKAAYQATRNFVAEIMLTRKPELAASYASPEEMDHEFAKSMSDAGPIQDAAYEAAAYLKMTPKELAEDKDLTPALRLAAEKARATVPLITEKMPLVKWLRDNGEGGFMPVGRAGSEGQVVRSQKDNDYVYKVFEPNAHLHLPGVHDALGAGGHLRLTVDRGNVFDTITKLDRQSRLKGGLPIEIQGITEEGELIVKMPRMARAATAEEAEQWIRDNGGKRQRTTAHFDNLATERAVSRQPFIQDEHSNHYATADIRPDEHGNYGNLMMSRDGRVFATDVLIRPIDAKDTKKGFDLRPFAPKNPDKILYSPDAAEGQAPKTAKVKARERIALRSAPQAKADRKRKR